MGSHSELGHQLPEEYQLQVRDGEVPSMESQKLLVPACCIQSSILVLSSNGIFSRPL